jgi:hypothetical protein
LGLTGGRLKIASAKEKEESPGMPGFLLCAEYFDADPF